VVNEHERKIVLAVDDNSAYLTICKKVLKKFYDVYTVLSAQQMFDLLKQIKPDLILLDVLMPVMNGYEAARILKANEEFSEIPIIFLTGIHDVQNEIEGFNIGAADYIHKPFNNSLLLQRIKTHLTLIENQKSLEAAVAEAKKADEAKSEFLSRMSHEIRTPLNAVIGMIYIAKNTSDTEKIKNCLDKADTASAQLLSIINDILDMSKIEANNLDLSYSEFDFEKTLMNIANVISARALEKNQDFVVKLNGNMPVSIISDELRLSQVITNLLSNAVKFTPENGTVVLTVGCGGNIEKDGEFQMRAEVSDTGIGISEEQQKRLFDLFEQADRDISRKYGGTGLGLAISKRIIDLMGGKIWIESEAGKGAKFIFTVNVKKGREKSWIEYGVNLKKSGCRILLAERSKETRDYFLHIAESVGLTCDTADNYDDIARKIKNGAGYDAFFVDSEILAERIGETAENPNVILLSNNGREAEESGIKRVMTKPVFPTALIDVISGCVGGNTGSELRDNKKYDFKGLVILAAEDIEINREILTALLEKTGAAAEYAEDGREAVEMFKRNPEKYSLILMDVHMPEMDGYEATRAIRAMPLARAKYIPIVAMTANVFREDIEACLESGMDDHLAKPIDPDLLFEKIMKYKDSPRLGADGADITEYDAQWDDSLSVGDAKADEQHKQLFEILNKLVHACNNGNDPENLAETLAFLTDNTITHFNDEEALQLRYNYPGYAAHRRMHEDFKDIVSDIVFRYRENGSSAQLCGEVNRVIVRWLIGHIRGEDRRLSRYIQSVLDEGK